MKKSFFTSLPLFALCFVLLLAQAPLVRADSTSSAPTPPVQKALESTKAYIDDLVTAKDDNTGNDTALRIETFRQVLDLSSAEAKDFEYKLLTIDKDDTFEPWKQNALDGLTKALVYYDSERGLLSDPSSIGAGKIKGIAEDFKAWRESFYIPLVTQIQDFILLKQEASAIQTASNRLKKIDDNLASLGYSPNGKDFGAYIKKATASIAEAMSLNRSAAQMFVLQYVVAAPTSTDESATTSTDASATTTPPMTPLFSTFSIASTSPTSTGENATSTSSSTPSQSAISIKGVVQSSLDQVKVAYQSFIDISNLVRKLLGQ